MKKVTHRFCHSYDIPPLQGRRKSFRLNGCGFREGLVVYRS